MHSIDTLLSELEAFGLANDAEHAERASRMLNITRDNVTAPIWKLPQ